MMGNYHVRFLGGKGVVTPLTYPVWNNNLLNIFICMGANKWQVIMFTKKLQVDAFADKFNLKFMES